MKTSCLTFAIVIGFQCIPAFAERKPDRPEDAKLVVWGTVEEVVLDEKEDENHFRVKIRVENIERGYIPRGAREFWANCFQRKKSAPKVPSASGHTSIPKKGQLIRAFLLEPRRGEFEGIYPAWFHELEINDEQFATLKWMQTIGPSCRVRCDDSLPNRPVTSMHLFKMWDSGVTNADMQYVMAFPELRSLAIYYSHVTEDGIWTVAKLPHLEELTLSHFRGVVTDPDLRPLIDCQNLRILNLMNAAITDESMSLFAEMPSLRTLALTGTKVTDAGLEKVKKHPHLESLTLSSTKIGDRGVSHLATMTSLKSLRLDSTKITDASLKMLTALSLTSLDLRDCDVTEKGLLHLSSHKDLQRLNLQNTATTDAVVTDLSNLSDLRNITLQNTQVTDTGFLQLINCPKLERVSIAETKITPKAVNQFKRALPDCQISQLSIE